MRYFIDTEFNGFQGELMTIALVAEDGRELYVELPANPDRLLDPWVAQNVVPVIDGTAENPAKPARYIQRNSAALAVGTFLATDAEPIVFSDWFEDIAHLMQLLILGPGKCYPIGQLQTVTIDFEGAFSTARDSAVPHNALYDARAMRDFVLGMEDTVSTLERATAPLVDMGDDDVSDIGRAAADHRDFSCNG